MPSCWCMQPRRVRLSRRPTTMDWALARRTSWRRSTFRRRFHRKSPWWWDSLRRCPQRDRTRDWGMRPQTVWSPFRQGVLGSTAVSNASRQSVGPTSESPACCYTTSRPLCMPSVWCTTRLSSCCIRSQLAPQVSACPTPSRSKSLPASGRSPHQLQCNSSLPHCDPGEPFESTVGGRGRRLDGPCHAVPTLGKARGRKALRRADGCAGIDPAA